MRVVNPSVCVDAPLLPYLHLHRNRNNHFPESGKCPRFVPARVSIQFQKLDKRKLPTLQAARIGSPELVDRKRSALGSTSRGRLFACSAALNARCSQGQTQTVTREAPTITRAPVHGQERSPKLDDGGRGFPPRDDGGGGGGGGGGENFSGGFFLFGFLLFLGYLKDLETEQDT